MFSLKTGQDGRTERGAARILLSVRVLEKNTETENDCVSRILASVLIERGVMSTEKASVCLCNCMSVYLCVCANSSVFLERASKEPVR